MNASAANTGVLRQKSSMPIQLNGLLSMSILNSLVASGLLQYGGQDAALLLAVSVAIAIILTALANFVRAAKE